MAGKISEAVRVAERGETDEALARLRRICDEHPRDIDARFACADVQLRAERYADAVATATIAIGLDHDDARGYYARARAQAGRGKLTEALDDARIAAAQAPSWTEASLMRGWLEFDHRNLVEAAEAAESVIAADRGKVDGHALLAEVALEAEQWDILAISARAVLRLRRDDRRAKELLAYAEARQAETDVPAWRPTTAAHIPEGAAQVEQVDIASVEGLEGSPSADVVPEDAPPAGSPRTVDLTDGETIIPLPPAAGSAEPSRRSVPPSLFVVAGAACAGIAVLALATDRPVIGAVLLLLGAGVVVAAFLRPAPDADRTRDRVRAQLGVPDRSQHPQHDLPAKDDRSAQPADASEATPAGDVSDLPRVVDEITEEEASSTIYVPSVSEEASDSDQVATLRAAADKAIEEEDWTAAEARLRRLLELEPLYIPAHGRLTYVLKQQRPSWSPRRQF